MWYFKVVFDYLIIWQHLPLWLIQHRSNFCLEMAIFCLEMAPGSLKIAQNWVNFARFCSKSLKIGSILLDFAQKSLKIASWKAQNSKSAQNKLKSGHRQVGGAILIKVVWIPLFLVCIPLLIISGLMFDYTPGAIPVNVKHCSQRTSGALVCVWVCNRSGETDWRTTVNKT